MTACALSLLEAFHFAAVLNIGAPQGFAPNGVFDHTLGSRGAADGQFYWPSGVAYGPSGELAVADSGNHRVQAFHPNGTFDRALGSRGAADGQFFYPAGVAYGPSGELAVADSGNHRVQVFGGGGWRPPP